MMLLMAVKRDEDKVCELNESKTHAKQAKGKREREGERKREREGGRCLQQIFINCSHKTWGLLQGLHM